MKDRIRYLVFVTLVICVWVVVPLVLAHYIHWLASIAWWICLLSGAVTYLREREARF